MRADPRHEIALIALESAEQASIGRSIAARARELTATDEALTTRSIEAISRSRHRLANRSPLANREQDLAQLKLADGHIVSARRHVQQQQSLIERLRSHGIPTSIAEDLLTAMQETLRMMEDHRALIRQRLDPAGDRSEGKLVRFGRLGGR